MKCDLALGIRMKTANLPADQEGASLLEALVSILIFSIGIVALMGLQAASLKNVADSKYRADAAFLANQLIGQMWTEIPKVADGSYADTSYTKRKDWDAVVKATLPSASTKVEMEATNRAKITIAWQAAGQDAHNYTTVANITE